MKRISIVLFAIITLFSAMSQTRKTMAPDFAYPDKVASTALRDLNAALKSGDGEALVNALVRFGLAKTAVSADSMPVVLKRIELVSTESDNLAVKALLNLLEAKIYTELYGHNSYAINRRATVAGLAGDNYELWSKSQFEAKVKALTDSAISYRKELLELPLTDYQTVISYERDVLAFYPTLYDFVAYQAIGCLDVFSEMASVLNPRLLVNPLAAYLYPSRSASLTGATLAIYSSLIDGRIDSAPAILARRNMIEYMLPRTFYRPRQSAFMPDGDQEVQSPRYEAYMTAYEECKSSPYAIELLLAIGDYELTPMQRKGLYDMTKRFAAENPGYFNINAVKNLINRLSHKEVNLDVPRQVAKGVPFRVKVHSENVGKVILNVYDVTADASRKGNNNYLNNNYYRIPSVLPAAKKSLQVEVGGVVPFRGDTVVELELPSYGVYVVVPSFEGAERKNLSYPYTVCSDLSLGLFGSVGGTEAVVVNPITGLKQEGASLKLIPWSRKDDDSMIYGTTNADGIMRVEKNVKGNLVPQRGDDKFAIACYYRPYSKSDRSRSLDGEIFTDLGLYHLGDTVGFSVVLYEDVDGSKRLSTGRNVKVELLDANFIEVDTLRLTTDCWGRGEGRFVLPSEGLTGNFVLRMVDEQSYWITKPIMVSDYKLPTFSVSADKVERPAKLGDDAVISGKAETFAGFPVADAQVKLQLKVRSGLWFWSNTSPVFYETSTQTDAKGDFSLVVPGDVMAGGPCPEGTYVVSVAVTSADGETHEATTGFNMGKPFVINVSVPSVFEAGSDEKAMVELRNYEGDSMNDELAYKVNAAKQSLYGGETTFAEVKSGSCRPGSVATILKELPSGVYALTFSTVDESLAEAVSVNNVVVYRKDDKQCPVESLLWLPEQNYTANEHGEVEIIYGTAVQSPQIFMTVSDNNGNMIERGWLGTSQGLNKVKLSLPAGTRTMRVYFRIVSNLESASGSVTVNSYESSRSIEIETVTFRDKVRPGDKETVTFKVNGFKGASAESAVMLDMSNKAIDQLAANPLNFVASRYWGQFMNVDGWYFGANHVTLQSPNKYLNPASLNIPVFNLYNRSFMPEEVFNTVYTTSRNLKIRGSRPMAAAGAVDDMNVVREHKEEVIVVTEDALKEESVTVGDAASKKQMDGGAAENGNGQPNEGREDVYRPSEMPLAFFRPMLTTDAEGNLEVTYTVPDANTTWILRSLAYNRELLTSSDEVEIMASKPVMVSTNAPRFIRCGDKVILKSSVMNALQEAVDAVTISEIINPLTGEVFASAESNDRIEPMGRKVVAMEFEAPVNLQGAIYRVKSKAGSFTDGEQVLMPILPSEQNVVESKIFYIAPDENHFTMEIDAVPEGRTYLNFTENPTWEVVSALPGLREGKINSSLDAAAALFSAAVADGLMNDNPEIARTLRMWKENPADSALTSRLQKNQQLKQILLSATPWVSDALSQTERMQRLALLLDSRNTSAAIAKAVSDLEKTVDADGGWYWTKEYPKVSEWCTIQVLDMLGDLNRMGWMPQDKKLGQMINKSVKWLDSVTALRYGKYPKSDYTLYCYTRSKFPAIKQSTAASKVTSATVQRIIAHWKEHGVAYKAVDAIVLAENNYKATARTIIESLREYATSTPEKGMWWQQLENTWSFSLDKVGITAVILDAFNRVDPNSPDIDKIRQWLVLNKTNNDWGNAVITSQVVSSILSSGRKWTVNPSGTAIRINDNLIEAAGVEYATGAFTEQITEMVKDVATLTVDRQGDYPSFGGVVTMRVAPMSDIKPVACSELSVDKRMSVFNGSEWIPTDRFAIGDRVKVTLVLKADTDLQYVVVEDSRAAGLEPVEQLPAPMWSEGLCFYRENRDDCTNIFIDRMPRGTYILEYELFATVGGSFASGVASAQSQYNPTVAAHSAGASLTIETE